MSHDRTSTDRPGGFRQEPRRAGISTHQISSEEMLMVSAQEREWFIVQCEESVSLRDRQGVVDLVRFVAQDSAFGLIGIEDVAVWRWTGHDHLEPIAIRCEYHGEFDADDYAESVWTATGPDGTTYADVAVRVDGRE